MPKHPTQTSPVWHADYDTVAHEQVKMASLIKDNYRHQTDQLLLNYSKDCTSSSIHNSDYSHILTSNNRQYKFKHVERSSGLVKGTANRNYVHKITEKEIERHVADATKGLACNICTVCTLQPRKTPNTTTYAGPLSDLSM